VTKRRVLLTGTPLQNNLKEYYHMVDYASPGVLPEIKSFLTLFDETIKRGQFKAADTSVELQVRPYCLFTDMVLVSSAILLILIWY